MHNATRIDAFTVDGIAATIDYSHDYDYPFSVDNDYSDIITLDRRWVTDTNIVTLNAHMATGDWDIELVDIYEHTIQTWARHDPNRGGWDWSPKRGLIAWHKHTQGTTPRDQFIDDILQTVNYYNHGEVYTIAYGQHTPDNDLDMDDLDESMSEIAGEYNTVMATLVDEAVHMAHTLQRHAWHDATARQAKLAAQQGTPLVRIDPTIPAKLAAANTACFDLAHNSLTEAYTHTDALYDQAYHMAYPTRREQYGHLSPVPAHRPALDRILPLAA